MERKAHISGCGLYRYTLTRCWDPDLQRCHFNMLNPSTADGETDDATIRRCIGYARDWGYGGFIVTNLFAIRSTDWRRLLKGGDLIGEGNDASIELAALTSAVTIVAWGKPGYFDNRKDAVAELLRDHDLYSIQNNGDGYPSHPLMLPSYLKPELWRGKTT